MSFFILNDSLTKICASPINNVLNNLPWSTIIEKAGRFVWERLSTSGLYSVTEHESTLELCDANGRAAIYYKRQRVRYLQDNIVAFQDQAWGEGRILLNYRCTPGFPVDRYQFGHKTLILISLREVKQRGDVDEFNIQWGIQNGFRKNQESWETEISHSTKRLRIRIIFPKDRPPQRRVCIEASRQIVHPIVGEYQRYLPDGRPQVLFEIEHPRLNERYILKWDW